MSEEKERRVINEEIWISQDGFFHPYDTCGLGECLMEPRCRPATTTESEAYRRDKQGGRG